MAEFKKKKKIKSVSYSWACVLSPKVRSRQEVTVQQISPNVKHPPGPLPGIVGVPSLLPLSSENLLNFRWVASRRVTPRGASAAAIATPSRTPAEAFQVSAAGTARMRTRMQRVPESVFSSVPPFTCVPHVTTPPKLWPAARKPRGTESRVGPRFPSNRLRNR